MAITYGSRTGSGGRSVSNEYAEFIDGMGDLGEQLQEIVQSISPERRKNALDIAAKDIVSKARGLAPVGTTGHLSGRGVDHNPATSDLVNIGWTADEYYGRFVELGTSKMAAQPHLRPAYEQEKDCIIRDMLEKFKLNK